MPGTATASLRSATGLRRIGSGLKGAAPAGRGLLSRRPSQFRRHLSPLGGTGTEVKQLARVAAVDLGVESGLGWYYSSRSIRRATCVMASCERPPTGSSSVVKRFSPSAKPLSAYHCSFHPHDWR